MKVVTALSPQQQLQNWLEGKPECPNTDGECCPDFSCCQQDLLVEKEIRKAYMEGDREFQGQLERVFLEAAMAKLGATTTTYIAGAPSESE